VDVIMARLDIDWEAVGKEWSLDQLSDRQLARKYGTSHTTIARKAIQFGWVKDKGAEVRRKTKAALIKQSATVPDKCATGTKDGTKKKSSTPTQEDIDKAVEDNVALIREHRKDIKGARNIAGVLSQQLLDVADHRERIVDLIEEDTKEETDTRRRKALLKAVSLPSNAGTLRDLTTALKNLIPLERQAFNIDKEDDVEEDALTAVIKAVQKRGKPLVQEPEEEQPSPAEEPEHPILGKK